MVRINKNLPLKTIAATLNTDIKVAQQLRKECIQAEENKLKPVVMNQFFNILKDSIHCHEISGLVLKPKKSWDKDRVIKVIFLDTGETYNNTLLRIDGKFYIGSWGELVENL